MSDNSLILEIIIQILHAIEKILKRTETIHSSEDFIKNESGEEKLDSVAMLLIAIGESIKQVDKLTDQKLLRKYPAIDWKGAKGMRDIISHHYFDIDEEIIFQVCKEKLPDMKKTFIQIKTELE